MGRETVMPGAGSAAHSSFVLRHFRRTRIRELENSEIRNAPSRFPRREIPPPRLKAHPRTDSSGVRASAGRERGGISDFGRSG